MKFASKPSTIDHYSKRLVTLITSSLHEVCGVWRPVGPVSAAHGQRFVPQLSAEGVLEAAQDKHHSLHDAIERHLVYRLGFRFRFGFWFGLWLGFWTLSLVWCLLGWRSCKIKKRDKNSVVSAKETLWAVVLKDYLKWNKTSFKKVKQLKILHQCLSNGCSAVNGCRQNEPDVFMSKQLIKTSQ